MDQTCRVGSYQGLVDEDAELVRLLMMIRAKPEALEPTEGPLMSVTCPEELIAQATPVSLGSKAVGAREPMKFVSEEVT